MSSMQQHDKNGRRGSVDSSGTPQVGGRRASIIGGEESAGSVKYLVLEKATVRAGPDSKSPKIGEHEKGAVIDVIQESVDDRGKQLLDRIEKGKQLLDRIGSAEDLGKEHADLKSRTQSDITPDVKTAEELQAVDSRGLAPCTVFDTQDECPWISAPWRGDVAICVASTPGTTLDGVDILEFMNFFSEKTWGLICIGFDFAASVNQQREDEEKWSQFKSTGL